MEYSGYKLLNKIMLVCQDKASDSEKDYYKAYLVDPSNKKQLDTARKWAAWVEYGPSVKNDEGKYVREWEIKHDPLEFEFDNTGFTLELLDCAGGSSQGGKLSFWNCLVKKDDKTFKIGIDSELLLDLLKTSVFDKGVSKNNLIFITHHGRVGMTAEGSETHIKCITDMELKKDLKKTATSKFSFGDIVKTPTIEDVYLGTITQYYTFDAGKHTAYGYTSFFYSDCTITKLAKPITYHMFDCRFGKHDLTEFVNSYDGSYYSHPDFKKSCPKRTIDGKINLDCSEEDFKTALFNKIYDYESHSEYVNKYYGPRYVDRTLYYFLSKNSFGYGFEPFEIPEHIMSKIKAAGIKYVVEEAK